MRLTADQIPASSNCRRLLPFWPDFGVYDRIRVLLCGQRLKLPTLHVECRLF